MFLFFLFSLLPSLLPSLLGKYISKYTTVLINKSIFKGAASWDVWAPALHWKRRQMIHFRGVRVCFMTCRNESECLYSGGEILCTKVEAVTGEFEAHRSVQEPPVG